MYEQRVIDQLCSEYGIPSDYVEITKWRQGPAPWMLFERRPEATGRVRLYIREWEFVLTDGVLAIYASAPAVVNDHRATATNEILAADRAAYLSRERIAARRAELRDYIAARSVV